MPRSTLPLRLLLAAGVSALALGPSSAAAQNALFRGRTNNPAAAAARAAQASVNEDARARVQAQRSMATFANAQAAISAMLAAQEAARQAALAAVVNVPNGLTTGGLDVALDPAKRVNVELPVQSGPAGAPTVTVLQTDTRAILTWRSFNVGRETTVNFDQSTFGGTRAREWSILNRVEGSLDPVSGRRTDINPTQILGKLNAPGQVFVIDRNGIIFGGASQVNVGTLVASALDVGTWNQTLDARNSLFLGAGTGGLLNSIVPPVQSGEAPILPQIPNLTVTDLTSTTTTGAATNIGREIAAAAGTDRFKVVVRPGAQIGIAELGFALLASPRQALNQGSIVAPSGQVHLAASAGLQFVPSTAGTAFQRSQNTFQAPDLGYLVEAIRHNRAANDIATPDLNNIRAEARNEGLVSTPRGSITLAGAAVANAGILSSTTAANRAGSVFLIARDYGSDLTVGPAENFVESRLNAFRFGEVRLGAGSLIDIGTESGPDQVVFDTATEPFRQSRVGINGSLVYAAGTGRDPQTGMEGLGAILRAPAARVRIAADLAPTINFGITAFTPETSRLQVFQLGSGAVIDVGGLKGVPVPVTRNFLDVTVRNQNLADQPAQRDGFLVELSRQRSSVVVDARLGTNLFDFRPFANNIGRAVAERQAAGGSVDIAAERVVTQPDSLIDVSGGWIAWQGGLRSAETSLIGSDGRIYRLSNAPADLSYLGRPGLFTRAQPRWGITENYVSPLFADRQVFEPGYVEGFDAGTINIAGQPFLAGTLDGRAFAGQRQSANASASQPNDGSRETSADLPNGATLRLYAQLRFINADERQQTAIGRVSGGVNVGSPTNPTFVTDFGAGLTAPLPEFDYAQPGALTTATPTATRAASNVNSDTRVTGLLPTELYDTRIATATTLDNGFGRFELEAEGRLTVPAGVAVTLRPGWFFDPGQQALAANLFRANVGSVVVDGAIRVAAGRILLAANAGDRILPADPFYNLDLASRPVARAVTAGLVPLGTVPETRDGVPTEGSIFLGASAVLSTRGLWVNDFLAEQRGEPRQGPAFVNGGSISLSTRFSGYVNNIRTPQGFDVQAPLTPGGAVLDGNPIPVFGRDIVLAAGAELDVSGGGRVRSASSRAALTTGAAGTIELLTYAGLATSPSGAARTALASAAGLYPGQRNFARDDRYAAVLDRGATLLGFGLAREGNGAGNGRGGTISLQAPVVVVGRPPTIAEAAIGVIGADPDRYAASGFADIRLRATNVAFDPIAYLAGSENSSYAGSLPHRGLPTGVLSVAPGTIVAPLPASLVLRDDFALAATGSGRDALGLVGRLGQSDRSPVRLSLTADNRLDFGAGDDPATYRTSLQADPGAIGAGIPAVTLATARELYFHGAISAPGGNVSITRNGIPSPYGLLVNSIIQSEFRSLTLQPGEALWIEAGARLSVAGTAQTVTDRFGVTRGAVRPGGSISLTDNRSTLVMEGARGELPAAQLDVSGTAATVSVQRGGRLFGGPGTQTIASDAGAIVVSGAHGVFLDGSLVAQAGAPGARGGTLTLLPPVSAALPLAPSIATTSIPYLQSTGFALPAERGFANAILIGEAARTALPVAALAALTDPTAPTDPTLARTPAGYTGGAFTDYALLNPNRLIGSGIDRLNLLGNIVVEGSPSLAVGQTLQISGQIVLRPSSVVGAAPFGTTVGIPVGAAPVAPPPNARLAAPYILLAGGVELPAGTLTPLAGTLTIAASGQLDVVAATFRGAEQVVLESAGDLRFVSADFLPPLPEINPPALRRQSISLLSQGNLTLRAAQTYPDTGVDAVIAVTRRAGDLASDPTRSETIPIVTFESFGGAPPQAPLVAGSRLTVRAERIRQAGVLRAPQGELVLAATGRITFAPGSFTSVAAEGRSVPLGQTRSDQNPLGVEIYDALFNLQRTNPGTGGGLPIAQPALAGPPTRAISLQAPSVDLQAGATVDLSGDGELLAYRFVAGPGGSRDILARTTLNGSGVTDGTTSYQFSDRRDVFAIVAGPQPYAAPRSPYIRDSGDSLGRGDVTAVAPNSAGGQQPAVGDQITIGPGIPGLAAGSYTLLPARYAIVPGGYQVVVPPAATGLRAEVPLDTAVRGGDGRYVVGGKRTVSGSGLAESQQRLITIRPPEVWQSLSQIVVDAQSGFFAQRAALTETPPPRLPIDAGRLTVSAVNQLVLDATARFARQPGGRGGQVEISADFLAIAPRERIVTVGEGLTAVAGADGRPRADLAGFLPVAGEALTALGAESLTLGGRRTITPNGLRITAPGATEPTLVTAEEFVVTARSTRLTEGASVTAPEVLLLASRAASDTLPGAAAGIAIEAGARLISQGDAIVGAFSRIAIGGVGVNGTRDQNPLVPGDVRDTPARPGAALIRVSTGPQVEVLRPDPLVTGTPLAAVELAENAILAGPTGTIDLVGNGRLADTVTFALGDLRIGSPRIVLGTPPTPIANAIVFGQGVVARLGGVNTLTLIGKGPEPIDVFGGVRLATSTRINLDASGLRAAADARLALQAGIVELRNTGVQALAPTGGSGALAVGAAEARLGTGGFALAGFGDAVINAAALVAAGSGRFDLRAPLAVTTGRVVAATGADVAIATDGPISIGGVATAGPGAIGGRLALTGSSVALGTRIEARGGSVTLNATAGDVVLQPGSSIDVSGLPIQFFDVTRTVPGGTARLAASGGISLAGLVDVSAGDLASELADAGRVEFAAGGAARFSPGGEVRGFAAAGARSGGFAFDGSGAVDLPAINDALDAGGFREARVVTAGAGDLVVEAGRTMAARQIVLTADAGSVVVGGTIDAGGPKGGNIELWARDQVLLQPTGRLTALNAEPGRRGGTISLGTTAGPLTVLGTIAAYRPGDSDPLYGGRVRVRLPEAVALARTSTIDPARIVARTGAEVAPFRVLELSNGTVGAADILPQSIFDAFTSLSGTTQGAFAPGLRVTPEIVVSNSTGGLRLAAGRPIDFCDTAGDLCAPTRRTAAGEGGVLTLRAAGDIEILSDITDGFSHITVAGTARDTGLVSDGRTGWSLRFTAGADPVAANPLATAGTAGSVLVGAPYLYNALTTATVPARPGDDPRIRNPTTTPIVVRTGTGSIEIGAALDIQLRDPDATVFTGGRRLAPPTRVLRPGGGGVEAYVYELQRFDPVIGPVTELFYLPIDPTYDINGTLSAAQGLRTPTTAGTLQPTLARYPVEGGDLTLAAGRDVTAKVTDASELANVGETANAWLRRNALVDVDGQFIYRPFLSDRVLFGSANELLRNTPAFSSQTSWFPESSAFLQNFGLLGGGDARISAGRDFRGSVSIPTSGITYGGLATTYDYSYRASLSSTAPSARLTGAVPGGGTAPITVVYGGGDLDLRVDRNLLPSSQLFLGRGTARVEAGGSIPRGNLAQTDQRLEATTVPRVAVGLLLALGDSNYRVNANGSIAATTYDPFQVRPGRLQVLADAFGYGGFQIPGTFTTTTAAAAVSLASSGGDVIIIGASEEPAPLRLPGAVAILSEAARGSFGEIRENVSFSIRSGLTGLSSGVPDVVFGPNAIRSEPAVRLPQQFSAVAFSGSIVTQIVVAPTTATAQQNITLSAPTGPAGSLVLLAGANIGDLRLQLPNRAAEEVVSPASPLALDAGSSASAPGIAPPIPGARIFSTVTRPSPDNVAYRFRSVNDPYVAPTEILRAADPNRDLVYALGNVAAVRIGGAAPVAASSAGFGEAYAKRIGVRAGRDVTDAAIYLLHANEGDVSFVRAGRDIGTALLASDPSFGNVIEIGGPGRLQIVAGRNIAPIRQPSITTLVNQGVTTTTAGALNGIRSIGNQRNILLPEGGAALDVLFGVGAGQGFDPDALLNRLLDPANAGAAYTTYRVAVGSILREQGSTRFVPGTAQANGGVRWFIQPNASGPTDPATLAQIRALPGPERLSLAIDLYFRELAAAGREAAGTTGPRQGSYVRAFDAIANLFPGTSGTPGVFNIQNTFIRTEQGGDVNVLGAGGDFLIGATAGGSPNQARFPDRFGVLTLNAGDINLFADGDIAAGESRIVTLDGGDILAYSSTADINAGLGARTARFVPPFRVNYLDNLVQVPNRAGQITGSGIATFAPFTPPEQRENLRRAPALERGAPDPTLVLASPLDRAGFAADAAAGRTAQSTEAVEQTDELRKGQQPLTAPQLALVDSTSTGSRVVLVAPRGTVDFGDAGVRVAGDLVVAAARVANAENATVAGTSVGVPTVAAPNVAGALAAASTAGAANQAAEAAANAARNAAAQPQRRNLVVTGEVTGFGATEAEALQGR